MNNAPQQNVEVKIAGVSTAATYEDKNVIITADDAPTLRKFLEEHKIGGTVEIRQTLTYVGPVVEHASITEIQNLNKGQTMAAAFADKLKKRNIDSENLLDEEMMKEAKESGLVVVYQDLCAQTVFLGAINATECGPQIRFTRNGRFISDLGLDAIESMLADGTLKERPVIHCIQPVIIYGTNEPDRVRDYHAFHTDIPHATFVVTLGDDSFDEDLHCRAIVFSILDL